MIKLAVGKPYPLPVAAHAGASANFLTAGGNVLQIAVPHMDSAERHALKKGPIDAGFIYTDGALLWVFQFRDGKSPVLTFDAPFDARLIPRDRLSLPDIDNAEQRLAIEIHALDTGARPPIVKALRLVTLSPKLTREFLSAVQQQLSTAQRGTETMHRWMQSRPDELARLIYLEALGQ